MDWFLGNSFFVLLLLICAGMHLFGHGHGRKSDESDGEDQGRREL